MPEELVINEEVSELIVESPIEAEFVVQEPATLELLETIEQGPPGPPGPPGVSGAGVDGFILNWFGF